MAERLPMSRRNVLSALALGATALGTGMALPARAGVSRAAGAGSATPLGGTPYTLTIINDSEIDDENAIVFQQDPNLPSDVQSLAWLSKMCHAGTNVTFNWSIQYNFVWGQTGTLKPGINYDAGQVIDADINGLNTVSLSYVDGGFEFGTPTADPSINGSLLINEDASVPGSGSEDQGSVGIGMFGAGTFVVPTQAVTGVQFKPTPTYWIAFGSYQAGTVVDESILTCPQVLPFPDGQTDAKATFDGKSWTITYG